MYLIFDTETTGLPRSWRAPLTDLDNWPRLVQIAWHLYDSAGLKVEEQNLIVIPEGFTIPSDAARIHGISSERAAAEGIALESALETFKRSLDRAQYIVAHNMSYDEKIVSAEFLRKNKPDALLGKKRLCTMESTTLYCAINGPRGYKWPSLAELHQKLFNTGFVDAHNAAADVAVTAKCFWELKQRGIIKCDVVPPVQMSLL